MPPNAAGQTFFYTIMSKRSFEQLLREQALNYDFSERDLDALIRCLPHRALLYTPQIPELVGILFTIHDIAEQSGKNPKIMRDNIVERFKQLNKEIGRDRGFHKDRSL